MTARPAMLPLLGPRDLAAPLCWRAGQAISAAQFIAEAQQLARDLPAGRPVNLCQDRYYFALGLAAALLRGQTSLMPPNALPETLRQAPGDGAAVYLMVDELPPGADTLQPRLHQHRIARPSAVPPCSDVPQLPADLQAVCLLTSGSTGAPQPHAKTWGALVANIEAEAARLATFVGQPTLAGITLVATVPAQHSYGLESTVLLALLGGASFDAGRPFYPADIADALLRVPAPRALVSTPFHLKTLLQAGLPLPPVVLTLCATAPLSPQLAAQLEHVLQGPLVEIYGCTEAGQVASRRTTAGETWHTLGALQIHREMSGDEEQFIVTGGHVTEPTPLADLLVLHSATQFQLLGRANDLIHVAGKRSSLAHLNFHLNRITGVDDGAFWLPDEAAGGVVRPVAFVVAPSLGTAQIASALRATLESAFVPRRIVHVAALPREATGKLTAAALRRFALQTLTAGDGPTPDNTTAIDIAPNHPAFAGHFPGHPVLPGVVLLSLVIEGLAARPALQALIGATPRIDSAKFLQPVRPGTRLQLVLQAQGRGVGFELRAADTVVAKGQLSNPSNPSNPSDPTAQSPA